MPSFTIRRRFARVLTATIAGLLLASAAWAQAVVAPRVVEFLPSDQPALVSRYDLEIVAVGTGQAVQRVNLGLPGVEADGLMRVTLPSALVAAPVAGATYTARIIAVGPTGATVSTASNPFLFHATPAADAPPAARTVTVATEPALQAAIAALTSGTTVVLAPGRYRLTATLRIAGNLTGVVITGATGLATDVILEGAGMTVAGKAPTAIAVTGRVDGLTVADLTIRGFAAHALTFARGPQAPRLTNLRLTDIGQAMITVGAGVNDGLLEHASLDYTTTGVSAAAAGIDLQGVRGWTVRLSAFRNVRGPAGVTAGAAVAASAGAADTTVSENLFIDCGRGIALGLTNVADGVDHRGGVVTNNTFSGAATVAGGAGIAITDSPDTRVTHNTVRTGPTAAPITYRFADSRNLVVADNLTDGPLVARDGAWAIESGNAIVTAADETAN
jgi:Right handed beta helix region